MFKKILILLMFVFPLYSQDSFIGKVTKLTDGDTIHVMDKSNKTFKIRFLNIDAPETNYQGQSQGHWGEDSKIYLSSLIPIGTTVKVESDSEETDQYGRYLGRVYKGNIDINLEMVKSGHAVMYVIYPNIGKYKEYSDAAKYAYENNLGIFDEKDPLPELPYEFRGHLSSKWIVYNCEMFSGDDIDKTPVYDRLFFFTKKDAENFVSENCQ